MAQEFRALQCFSCSTFQVDQVKKSPKWSCKICQQSQTVKTEFARGSAKNCRLVVQQLNEKLHEKANEVNEEQENSRENASKPIKRSHDEVNTEAVVYNNKWTRWSEPEALEEKEPETQISVSKWSKFKEQD